MANPEWGAKHECDACGAKFYDMQRQPPTCPKCGSIVEIEAKKKTRPSRVEEAPRRKPKAVPADSENEEVDNDLEEIEDEEADDILEDDEELDDDAEIGVDLVENESEDD